MTNERKPYSLSELHILLENIRLDRDDVLNIPRAFLTLVNHVKELTERVEYLENKMEDGITLVNEKIDEV